VSNQDERPQPEESAEGWSSVAGLTQRQAEDLLDWLEAHGVKERLADYVPGSGVTVRWRR
jgi:hypothetical protein